MLPSPLSTTTRAGLRRQAQAAGDNECPVCLDKPLYPAALECGHKYCFLCAKGLILEAVDASQVGEEESEIRKYFSAVVYFKM